MSGKVHISLQSSIRPTVGSNVRSMAKYPELKIKTAGDKQIDVSPSQFTEPKALHIEVYH